MIFSLVAAAQEWLNEKYDKLLVEKEESAMKKQIAEEEAERVRDLYTFF